MTGKRKPKTGRKDASHPVGTEIEVSAEDKATLSKASDPLQAAYTLHSLLRRKFLIQEQQALAQIVKAEEQYQAALILIGRKYDVSMGPNSGQIWNYGGDSGILKRLG